MTTPEEHPEAASDRRARRGMASRLLPLFVALLLGVLTSGARQWEMLAGGLPRIPDWGAYRFAPSGNEWRLRRWSAFGAERYTLRRTFTRDDAADPGADARAAFADVGLPRALDLTQWTPDRRGGVSTAAAAWGWPLRHTASDSLGRRRILHAGFWVNSVVYTPVWLGVLYVLRGPVAWVMSRLQRPAWACRRCRYDLRGIPEDAPCPECGRERTHA